MRISLSIRSTFLLFVTILSSIMASGMLKKASSSPFSDGDDTYTLEYQGKYLNTSLDDFTFLLTVSGERNSRNISIEYDASIQNNVDEYLRSIITINDTELLGMLPYTEGVMHSTWSTRKVFYEDDGNTLRVYDKESLVLLYIEGKPMIDSTRLYINVILTTYIDRETYFTNLDNILILFAFITGTCIAVFMIYIFGFHKKHVIKKERKNIEKSGAKLERYQSKTKKNANNR